MKEVRTEISQIGFLEVSRSDMLSPQKPNQLRNYTCLTAKINCLLFYM